MFDRMGRQFDQQPLSSYAGNNALAGMANFGPGKMPQFGGQMPMQQPMVPPGAAPMQPQVMPGQVPMEGQSALGGFGQAAPPMVGPQGLPQQFADWRTQMQDWRGMRPDRPDFGAMRGAEGFDRGAFRDARQDYRGQMQDWRGQRPQFANWR